MTDVYSIDTHLLFYFMETCFHKPIKERSLNQHSSAVSSRFCEVGGIFLLHSLDVHLYTSSLPSLQTPITESYMNHIKELVNLSVSQEGLYLNRTQGESNA